MHDSTASDQLDTFDIDQTPDGHKLDYLADSFVQQNNFTRIEVDREAAQVRIINYDIEGKRVFGEEDEPRLNLEAW